MQTNFADALINISLTGPLVRLEFASANPTATQDGKQEVKLVPTQQLVMPLEGFIRSFGLQENVIKKLIADGVLKPNQQAVPQTSDIISTSGV